MTGGVVALVGGGGGADGEHERRGTGLDAVVVSLLGEEVELPRSHAHRHQLALVVVEDQVPLGLVALAHPVIEVVDTIDDLLVLLENLFWEVGQAGGGEGGEEVLVALDAVEYGACGDLAVPAGDLGDADAALVDGHLLSAEGSGAAVRPGVVLGAVVGGVGDGGVLTDAHVLEDLQHGADVVTPDH